MYNKHLGRKEYIGTFLRKRDAQQAELRAKLRIVNGEPVFERKEIGLSDLVDEWLQTLTVRDSTREEYEHTTNHLRGYFKNRPVSGISREQIQRFVAQKVGEGYSDRYVRKMVTRLSQVLNTAIDWGYLTVSPTAGGIRNLPPEPRREVRPLSAEDVRSLVEAAPDYWRPAPFPHARCMRSENQ